MAGRALVDQQNRIVQVKREHLLDILKANREKHCREYREAIAGYKVAAVSKLREYLAKGKAELERNVQREIDQISQREVTDRSDSLILVQQMRVDLPFPRDFTSAYDAAIDMVAWDVRDVLELTHAEFQCFVRDVWDWSDDFRKTASTYR